MGPSNIVLCQVPVFVPVFRAPSGPQEPHHCDEGNFIFVDPKIQSPWHQISPERHVINGRYLIFGVFFPVMVSPFFTLFVFSLFTVSLSI